MNDPIVTVTFEPSGPFAKMAADIEANKERPFAGAFVIMPPEGGPEACLILDQAKDPSQFFALLKTRCEIALQAIDDAKQQRNPFGGRR